MRQILSVERYDFGHLIFRVFYEYNRLMRAFSTESGLYSGQPRILTQVKDNEGCTLSELSDLTGVGMPSLSVSVRNMKKTGLIKENEHGSRGRGIFLTEEGMEKAVAFHELVDVFFKEFHESYDLGSSEQFCRTLEYMQRFMEQYQNKTTGSV